MRLLATAMAAAVLLLGCLGTPLAEAPLIVPPQPWTPAQGEPTSIQKWAAAMQPPTVVAFFDGLFERVGVRIADTGEAFTCIHDGDRVLFSDELDEESVDFVVAIDSGQVDRMLENMKTGELDEAARFRIMAVIATPSTEAMLKRPAIRSEWLRSFLFWIGGAEPLMQVVLVGPPGEQNMAHTIARVNGATTVTPGLHGEVSHIYQLTVDDAVTYQRRMLAARKANGLWSWITFARWYGEFREKVVVPVPEAPVPEAQPD